MDFFEKIMAAAEAAAGTVTERSGDFIGIAKLTAKVASENAAIHEAKKKIGDMVYREYRAGGSFSVGVAELCAAVRRSDEAIAALQAEIAAAKAAARGGAAAPAHESTPEPEPPKYCYACGGAGHPDALYCVKCGARLS